MITGKHRAPQVVDSSQKRLGMTRFRVAGNVEFNRFGRCGLRVKPIGANLTKKMPKLSVCHCGLDPQSTPCETVKLDISRNSEARHSEPLLRGIHDLRSPILPGRGSCLTPVQGVDCGSSPQ
jgi:hypothetical protein